ncbi:ImmA/IrrE family metallo-endopeptidase [Anaeromicropila populeti]|uniref:IrrE N-terminal-like domain-containing protein n=1 Tax=Anaeromicropila populeti TaxID=37658 RepID=A0A1I6JHR4_9FIRM|nr:ImmA/IrrE family metallo-endopeptidase [Anaeromicropila populeti]SFR78485.1 protein of unknown function [Anaeromicropila populeti]
MINGYITPKELEQMVTHKLESLGITEEDYPLCPFKLIARENILLYEESFLNENIRGMLVHGPNISGIIVNKNRSNYSKRFIAMHELSHYWFHPHIAKYMCLEETRITERGIEWQANQAASYALLPQNLLEQKFYEFSKCTQKLSSFFEVSEQCIIYRLQNITTKKLLHHN